MRGVLSIDWVGYGVLAVCVAWTIAMMVHVVRLGNAFQSDDWTQFRELNRKTMWRVAVWQILLGVSMGIFNIDREGGAWMPVITMCGSGLGILALDRAARKFRLGVWEQR